MTNNNEEILDIDNVEEKLNEIMEFEPTEETVQFREWNDEMLNWLVEYKGQLKEGYEEGKIDETKYNELNRQIKDMAKGFIDEDYVNKLTDKLFKMNISFVNSDQELDKKSYNFDEFVRITSMRMGSNPQIFYGVIDLTIKKFAETEEEVKAFKSILYKLTQQSNLISESSQTQFKFLHLFMKSMHTYSLPLFNEIAKKYVKEKEGDLD
jgi:hypothetical protein